MGAKLRIIGFMCLWTQGLFAQKELNFWVDMARFEGADKGHYVEIYLAIDPTSIAWTSQNNRFTNETQVLILIQDLSNPDYFLHTDKFTLHTERPDTHNLQFVIWDMKRYTLTEGKSYRIEVHCKDLSQKQSSDFAISKELNIEKSLFSDFCFYSSLKQVNGGKYGYELTPLVSNYHFFNQDTLRFWIENYQKDSLFSAPYFYRVYLKNVNSQSIVEGTEKVTKMRKSKPFEVLNFNIPIQNVPSQTYWLCIEMKTNDGKILASKSQRIYIYNSNVQTTLTDQTRIYDVYFGYPEKELEDYLQTLVVIGTPTEAQFIKSLKTFEEKKNFFVNFWTKRSEGADHFLKAWREHKTRVDYANAKFSSSIRKGYLTDRGRTLLLYGPPNDLQSFPQEGDKYPYEIWFYNKLGKQQGVIFVFFDPDLITNEYPLLHSNKFGEFNNKSWRNDLIRGKPGTLGADDPEFNKIERTKFRDTLPLEMR